MKLRTLWMLLVLAIVLLTFMWPLSRNYSLAIAAPQFTGDYSIDFTGPKVIRIDNESSGVRTSELGLPIQFPNGYISPEEMNAVYLEYD